MGKKEPAWKSYQAAVQSFVPRLVDGEELEHRSKMLWARDWANGKRSCVGWQTDHALVMIGSLVSAYAMSSALHPGQVKTLWETVASLMEISAKLQGSDLP
jgi:hypothetical protein